MRGVGPTVSGLSEVLAAANAGARSARAIAREAQQLGYTLNHDTAARYLRGDHGTPDEATLVAFAAVLNVPMKDLRTAAQLPSESTDPYVPPAEASRLSRRQRRAVDEVIRSMLEPSAGDGRQPARRAPLAPAARRGKAEPPRD